MRAVPTEYVQRARLAVSTEYLLSSSQMVRVPFDPEQRAREKQASRDEDERALASGQKSREQLKHENGAFAFPRDRLRLEQFK